MRCHSEGGATRHWRSRGSLGREAEREDISRRGSKASFLHQHPKSVPVAACSGDAKALGDQRDSGGDLERDGREIVLNCDHYCGSGRYRVVVTPAEKRHSMTEWRLIRTRLNMKPVSHYM